MESRSKLLIGLSLVCLFISFAVYQRSVGFDRGLSIIEQHYEELLEKERIEKGDTAVSFGVSGGNETIYEYLDRRYGWLTLLYVCLLAIFIIDGKLQASNFGRRLFSNLLIAGSLTTATCNLIVMIHDKNMSAGELYWNIPRWELIRQSVSTDWILVALTLTIAGIYLNKQVKNLLLK
jgi:hypothetical protein